MKDQETFKLPISGKEVVIKGFVSGAIDAEVQSIIREGYTARADVIGDNKVEKTHMDIKMDSSLRAEKRAMELMLISLDGDTSNVYQRVMELPAGDTDFITEKINDITEKSKVKPTQKKS